MIAELAALLSLTIGAEIVDLGQIEFPNSGAPEAQESFLRGALLLHSFEYEDSAEAFREAQELDADFALAFWGEALTHSHPIWGEDDPEEARAVLARFGASRAERLAKIADARERRLFDTVEILFGEGTRVDRNRAYSAALEKLYVEYPDDLEIGSFYALSILGTSGGIRDIPTYMRAAAVGEVVFARNPRHPGALHYLIHSYDDPVHAPLGLRQARLYDKVAPAAAHALHMPSHIYVALGLWDDSVAANIASYQAADARRERKDLSVESRGFHALYWLEYSYLQQGRREEALELLRNMVRDEAESHSERTRSHLALMRAAYVVDGSPDPSVAAIEVDTSELGADVVAADYFIDGYLAAEAGEFDRAREILREMSLAREAADAEDGVAGCCRPAAALDGSEVLDPRFQAALTMELELDGWIRLRGGERDAALALLWEAARTEDLQAFDFGPPMTVKPAHELLAEACLGAGLYEEAQAEFQAALRRAPGRSRSLWGLWKAAVRTGDEALVLEGLAGFERNWKRPGEDASSDVWAREASAGTGH